MSKPEPLSEAICIQAAFDIIIESGDYPTAAKLREALGRGSLTTIQTHMGAVKRAIAKKFRHPDIPQPVFDAAQALWEVAVQTQNEQAQKLLDDAERLNAEGLEKLQVAAASEELHEEAIQHVMVQLSEALEEKESLENNLRDANEEIAELKRIVEDRNKKIAFINDTNDSLKEEITKLEAHHKKNENLLNTRIDELKQQQKKDSASHKSAIEALQKDGRQREKELKIEIKEIKNQLKIATKNYDKAKTDNKDLNKQLLAKQTEYSELQVDVASLTERLDIHQKYTDETKSQRDELKSANLHLMTELNSVKWELDLAKKNLKELEKKQV